MKITKEQSESIVNFELYYEEVENDVRINADRTTTSTS